MKKSGSVGFQFFVGDIASGVGLSLLAEVIGSQPQEALC